MPVLEESSSSDESLVERPALLFKLGLKVTGAGVVSACVSF